MADDTDPASMLSIELDQAYKATYVKLDYLQKYGVGWILFDEIETMERWTPQREQIHQMNCSALAAHMC